MKPLEIVYWLRLGLGALASVVCVGYVVAGFGTPLPSDMNINIFLNSMSLAIIVYLISYYVIKARFKLKVEKTQKLFTTGIGAYFLSWLVSYSLMYTALAAV